MAEDAGEQISRALELDDSELVKEELLPLIYYELRALARRKLMNERADHTLQPTALVHEAYLRLVGDRNLSWQQRSSFFFAASEAMRRVLVDHARKKMARKRRDPNQQSASLGSIEVAIEADPAQLLDLDAALSRLETEDVRAAEIVRLRYFAGLSVEEVQQVTGLSERTLMRELAFARARLCQILRPEV